MKGSRHIVYVVSEIEKSLAFEWIASALKDQYRLTFVLLNAAGSSFENFLLSSKIDTRRIIYRGKKDFIWTFLKLFWYFLWSRPEVVHAHLFAAQITALSAAKCAFIKKRIYTRHNSNFHHVYFPKGVRFDLLSNYLATHIVSISQSTYTTLTRLEKVKTSKIRKISHGFELSVFGGTVRQKIHAMRAKWQIPETHPCVGVVARHVEWKGIQFVIPAFRKLLDTYPSAVLVLANAHGPYHKVLLEHLADISRSNYVLIPFEEDVVTLYALFDLYVHVPVDELCEAFGQTYVEALASGVPSIFTKSGIASEFISHGQNAWVVDYQNSEEILQGMKIVLADPGMQQRMREDGKESVNELFDLQTMVLKLKLLYDE